MADDAINTAIEFLEKIKSEDYVHIKFIKTNGEVRTMRCTLDFDKVPPDKRPKDVNLAKILKLLQKNRIVHVYDLDKDDWRSVPFDRSEWLETPERRRFKIRR